jgi:hypothetical protein
VRSSHSTHVALDQCVPRVYGVKRRTQRLKDQVIMVKLRTRELNLEVLLWQGLKDETLGREAHFGVGELGLSALSSFLSLMATTSLNNG